jgi:hypothetical protein
MITCIPAREKNTNGRHPSALALTNDTVVALWEDEKASTSSRLKLLQPTPVMLMHAWHLIENHGRNMQAGRGSEEEGQPEPAWDRSVMHSMLLLCFALLATQSSHGVLFCLL